MQRVCWLLTVLVCAALCVPLASGCRKAAKPSTELDTSELKGLGSGKGSVTADDIAKAREKAEGFAQPSGK